MMKKYKWQLIISSVLILLPITPFAGASVHLSTLPLYHRFLKKSSRFFPNWDFPETAKTVGTPALLALRPLSPSQKLLSAPL